MEIIWTNFAIYSLREIFNYYKKVAGYDVANNLRENIFAATKQLTKHSESGQIEIALLKLNEGHRYLVCKNYKIIYKIVKEGVLITDIFDTRQDPVKINNPKRKS